MVGALTYDIVRDEPPRPTTTTTTTRPPTADEVSEAIVAALGDGLDVTLDAMQTRCITNGLLAELGHERLVTMADAGVVEQLSSGEQEALVRAVVLCLPPDKAALLLSRGPTTTIVVELPDEGTDP